MRKLGLDIGEKRIGVAVSDATNAIAKPLTTIERRDIAQDVQSLKHIIDEYEIEEIVAGLPIDLRGEKSIAARKIEDYLRQLQKLIQIPIKTFDERLTTKIASSMLKSAGLTSPKRKKVIDEVAAMVILQGHLDINR